MDPESPNDDSGTTIPGLSPGFAARTGFDAATVDALILHGMRRTLTPGERLIEQDTAADEFYLVLNGRFTVYADGRPIAEIASGEPAGEIAFFSGGRRTATVKANRASEVLVISKQAYSELCASTPSVADAIIRALATRLAGAVRQAEALKPRGVRIVTLLPTGGREMNMDRANRIVEAFRKEGRVEVLETRGLGKPVWEWVAVQSLAEVLIIIHNGDDHTLPDVLDNTDAVVMLTDAGDMPRGPDADMIRDVETRFLQHAVHLAIFRTDEAEIRGTGAMLDAWHCGMHHHLRETPAEDYERMARLLRGTALGAVFGGGGAFGMAHLGMIKALQQHGFHFDLLGGASVGAAMAGATAMGLSPDEVARRCEEIFVKSKAMKRLTVPIFSILDQKLFDRQLNKHYGNVMIEDLPVNYFAAATSLTSNDLAVRRRGELWRAVRASGSIPAVLPPMVFDDGEVLIDGAVIDNVPISTMRSLKPGPNLVLSFESKGEWRVQSDYNLLPGRAGAMRRLLPGKIGGPRFRFPTIATVLTRTMVVNSQRNLTRIDQGEDIFVALKPQMRMGFLEWTKGEELFRRTYDKAVAELDVLARDHSGLDLLVAYQQRLHGQPSEDVAA